MHAQNPLDRSKINDLEFIADLIFKVHDNRLVRAEHHEIVDVHGKSEQNSIYVLVEHTMINGAARVAEIDERLADKLVPLA